MKMTSHKLLALLISTGVTFAEVPGRTADFEQVGRDTTVLPAKARPMKFTVESFRPMPKAYELYTGPWYTSPRYTTSRYTDTRYTDILDAYPIDSDSREPIHPARDTAASHLVQVGVTGPVTRTSESTASQNRQELNDLFTTSADEVGVEVILGNDFTIPEALRAGDGGYPGTRTHIAPGRP